MRFCVEHQLDRTRRVLAEVQTGIEKAARRRKRYRFTPEQDRIAREWHERQLRNKEAS